MTGPVQTESYPVRAVLADKGDYAITVKASVIRRAYNKLVLASELNFQWDEFALVAFSSLLSVYATVVVSGIALPPDMATLFLTVVPVLAGMSLVIGIMLKVMRHRTDVASIREVTIEFRSLVEAMKEDQSSRPKDKERPNG